MASAIIDAPTDVWRFAEPSLRMACARLGLAPDVVRADRVALACDASAIDPCDRLPRLQPAELRRLGRTTTAVFQQTQFGVPVWGAFFAVQIEQAHAPRVIGSQHSLKFCGEGAQWRLGVHVDLPRDAAHAEPGFQAFDELARRLRVRTGLELMPDGRPREQLFIYRYDESSRLGEIETTAFGFVHEDLGPVAGGRDRFVTEVVARSRGADGAGLWWRALIDLETGAVLYLRALLAAAFPTVLLFRADPATLAGAAHTLTFGPGDWDAELDRFRGHLEPVEVRADRALMRNEFVEVVEIAPPPLRWPDLTGFGAQDSRARYLPYVRGDFFARATAVHHLDGCVRTLQSIGVNVSELFAPGQDSGTVTPAPSSLPIKVDPCVDSIAGIDMATNAVTLGNATGVEGVCIGQLAVDAHTTAAIDPRLLWHEFGHVLLYSRDPRSNGSLPFAHGIGDALAAIHFDPDSAVRDDSRLRGLCFPWFRNYRPHRIARRHDWTFDEPEEMIWARETNLRLSEEVLSSTLFRIYRAAGGDSPSPVRRRLASDYVGFLIVQAVGIAKIATIVGPREFRDLLIAADAGFDRGAFQDVPRGALEKVIRWAFEEQGLDAWRDDTGRWRRSRPDVDVFIDPAPASRDDHAGWSGYPGSEYFWESQAIWNRREPDAEVEHQTPRPGGDNFLCVRIRHRGRLAVPTASVRMYYQRAVMAPIWPADSADRDRRSRWLAATPLQHGVSLGADGADVADAVFVWRPDVPGPWTFLAAVAAGETDTADRAALEPAAASERGLAAEDRALWAVAPYDNNLAVRSIGSVPAESGAAAVMSGVDPRVILTNPYRHRACTLRVVAELPSFLQERGWDAAIEPNARAVTLAPGETRQVTLRLRRGCDFAASDLPAALEARRLRIFSVDVSRAPMHTDGIVTGGLTYDFERSEGPASAGPARAG